MHTHLLYRNISNKKYVAIDVGDIPMNYGQYGIPENVNNSTAPHWDKEMWGDHKSFNDTIKMEEWRWKHSNKYKMN